MKRKIFGILFALVLVVSFSLVAAVVSANPGGAELQAGGNGTATWSTEPEPVKIGGSSVKLYVADGTVDWAQVSIPVDIAIEDITELKIWEYIESATTNRELRIYLGIDSDGDGDFEADVCTWLSSLYKNEYDKWVYDPAHLHGDTFIIDWGIHIAKSGHLEGYTWIEDDIEPGEWTQRDILAGDHGVLTPNADGVQTAARYQATMQKSFDSGIPAFIDRLSMSEPIPTPYSFIDPGRVELGDRVKVIEVWIGRSSSWMDATVYVDDLTMNSETYELEPPLLPMSEFEIDKASIDFGSPAADKVSVKGTLALANGNGVDIDEDDVTVTVGPLSEIIHAGTMVEKDGKWECKGFGAIKKMKIDWNKGKFEFSMDNVNLSGLADPATVYISLQVGDDLGEKTIPMTEKKRWDYKAP